MVYWRDYLTIQNIVVAILTIIGLVWLISSLWRNWKISRINNWPKTNATVINSVAEPEKVTNALGSTYLDPRYLSATTDTSTKYIPRILYRYNINGQEFQSNDVMYGGDQAFNALDIKTIMGNIGPGSTIQVYYNPSDLDESYVLNGTPNYMGALLGLALLAIAAAIGYNHNIEKLKRDYTTTTTTKTAMKDTTPRLTTDETPRNVLRTNATLRNDAFAKGTTTNPLGQTTTITRDVRTQVVNRTNRRDFH